MPTYSYKCTNCGNAFDIVQSFTDDALTVCEVCQGTLRKVFSPVGVTFNGSGFYRTDSRGSATKSSSGSDSSSGGGSSDSGSSSPSTPATGGSAPASKPASTSTSGASA